MSKKRKKNKPPEHKDTWKRCRDCGRLVRVPMQYLGKSCPKCGEPLSTARNLY